MPQVSVILPFFNSEHTVSRAIESILCQTYKDFELVLIDNNSSDKSLEIANKFASENKNVILLHETRQGVAYASNTGMEYSDSKYLARMDADDFSYPERLEKQVKFLEDNPGIDLVGTRVKYVGSVENEGFRSFVDRINLVCSCEEIFLNRFTELQIVNPSIMFRKSTASKFGLYKSGNFPEDYEFFLRWLDAGCKMEKLTDVLLDWNDSAKRLTRTSQNYSVEAFYEIKTPFLVNFLRKINPYFPKVVIWGAGKKSKKRAELLLDFGIEIEFYIDVSAKKQKVENCIIYKDLPENGNFFILSYVGNRGVAEQIREFLIGKKYSEGVNFLLVS